MKSTLSPLSPTQFPLTTPLKPYSLLLISPGFLYANVSRYLNESFSFLSYFPQKLSQSFLLSTSVLSRGLGCVFPPCIWGCWAGIPFSVILRPSLVQAFKGQAGTWGGHGVWAPIPREAPGQSGECHHEGPRGGRTETCSHGLQLH